jgi:hypothetical protein
MNARSKAASIPSTRAAGAGVDRRRNTSTNATPPATPIVKTTMGTSR